MKQLLILTLLLAGCSTAVPVKRNFPEVPEELKTTCPELKEVADGTTKLSDVLIVVTDNYAEYKGCQIKVDLWNEWYKEQKKIFDEVNQ